MVCNAGTREQEQCNSLKEEWMIEWIMKVHSIDDIKRQAQHTGRQTAEKPNSPFKQASGYVKGCEPSD